MRGWQARERCALLDEARQKQRAKEEAATIKVQCVYRGHKGRLTHLDKVNQHLERLKLERESTTTIARIMRGYLAAGKHVNEMKEQREQKMLSDARSYIETWSDDAFKWFYYNASSSRR